MTFIFKNAGLRPLPGGSIQSPHDQRQLVAQATEPYLASAVYKAFLTLRSGITTRDVYSGMSSGSLLYHLRPALVQFEAALRSATLLLGTAHAQSGALLTRQLTVRKTTLEFDLDSLPEPTQDALDGYQYGLVREVSDDTIATISQVVSRGITNGWSPAKMARQLQGSVGLTTTQEAALTNYRSLLENGSPEALDRALRDTSADEDVRAHIEGTNPLDADQIDRLVSRYEDRYLRYRANTIARYESLRASNQGASDAVQSAIDDGTLDPSNVFTTWKIHSDELTCPMCRSIVEIQPDGVQFGTPFTWAVQSKRAARTGQVAIAPAHPSCRCVNGYRVVHEGGDVAL